MKREKKVEKNNWRTEPNRTANSIKRTKKKKTFKKFYENLSWANKEQWAAYIIHDLIHKYIKFEQVFKSLLVWLIILKCLLMRGDFIFYLFINCSEPRAHISNNSFPHFQESKTLFGHCVCVFRFLFLRWRRRNEKIWLFNIFLSVGFISVIVYETHGIIKLATFHLRSKDIKTKYSAAGMCIHMWYVIHTHT